MSADRDGSHCGPGVGSGLTFWRRGLAPGFRRQGSGVDSVVLTGDGVTLDQLRTVLPGY